MRTILVFRSIARPIEISYLSPRLIFSPSREISESRPFLKESQVSSLVFFMTSSSSSLVYEFVGSRFYYNVPSKMKGSQGMTLIMLRCFLSFMELELSPQRIISPSVWSIILAIPRVRLDFPAPVRPTMPIFSPKNIFNVKFERTSGIFYRYLNK